MRKLTLSVRQETLEAARIIAAERKTSMSGLVREYLDLMGRQKSRAKDAMDELRALSEKTEAQLGPDYKFDRISGRTPTLSDDFDHAAQKAVNAVGGV